MASLDLRVPPVLAVLVVAALMTGVARAMPVAAISIPERVLIAAVLLLLGVLMAVAGVLAFRRHRTTVDPLNPDRSTALVTSGVYRFSRNPMYLGFLLTLLALGIYLSNLAALLFPPTFVLYMNRFQIWPEEQALARTFGATFDAYAKSVRRWI